MAEPGDFQRFVAALGEVPRPSLHRQLFDAYAEAAALRERVQAERERRESAENNMASWEDTARRFVEQNAALRERAERLAGLLGEAEFGLVRIGYSLCFWCGRDRGIGHAHDCRLAALADAGGGEG